MRSVNDESLKENPGDLLLDGFLVGLGEKQKQGATEVLRVRIGIPETK